MPVQIYEPISVVVVFSHGTLKPVLFRWQNKKITIDRVSFNWQTNEGTSKILHFSAVVGQDVYELVFNSKELTWRLEQIENN